MNSTLLVDGDIVAYQIAFRTETPIRWENEVWTLHSDERECKQLIDEFFITLNEDTLCSNVIIAFSDSANFRKKIFPEYKLNRIKQRKPLTLKYCKEYMKDNYKTYIKPALEADDVLGILGTSNKLLKGTKIIVSTDKDLKQIAGLHYNPITKEFFKVSKREAEYNFYMQILTGDPVDNYKGCPSYGEVKSNRVLSLSKNYWNTVVKCYIGEGLKEEDALTQARVARILKHTDYNFKKEEPKLWKSKTN